MSHRRQYPFHVIEPKWQNFWAEQQTFRAWNPGECIPENHPLGLRHGIGGKEATPESLPPKYYLLDMFPYPSGAGLHVGHPEGYTATDILARFHRAQGYHVLHPMGWDAFGLPAEQYAIRTGRHPRQTTNDNIATFKRQIQSLGFSYDWSREIDTTDTDYYRWTQWIFLEIYNSWYNPATDRAEPITTLKYPPELEELNTADGNPDPQSESRRRAFRDSHRLAYVTEAPVWWCEALATVLANEEVIDGRSEIGGHPVVRRPMRQWMLRITAYAERLLADLERIDWSHSLKEMQRNWIGKSEGAEIEFPISPSTLQQSAKTGNPERLGIRVFTTRPDTLFGATYMVLAPEHPLVARLTRDGQREAVDRYREEVARKSDLERTDLAKEKTGIFIGAYVLNPATGTEVPIWIADYVLASYGTGAIMAVPAHDTRDWEFAHKFNLPVVYVVGPSTKTPSKDEPADRTCFVGDGFAVNSANNEVSLNGLPTSDAKKRITTWLESKGLGRKMTQFKLRDWLFSRQRYWGEPFPIVWKRDKLNNLYHEPLAFEALPVRPPDLDDYKPTPDGRPPLARARSWVQTPDGGERETNTMPQWAGSCWYYLRYLDPRNKKAFCGTTAESYWMGSSGAERPDFSPEAERATRDHRRTTPGVDLYVGGTEHAVLHLLYARFWHKVLFDRGRVSTPEPFHRLVNQGLILGEDGQKMSKSRGNVVNPDEIMAEYGADAFRLYEMFMGPLQDAKPWNTKGVEGVYRFLGRVWRLFIDESSEVEFEQGCVLDSSQATSLLEKIRLSPALRHTEPSAAQMKTLHTCIRKVTEDLEGLRFNTAISAMMVFVNDAISWQVKPVAALRAFLQLLAPFAPHLAEELWSKLERLPVESNSTNVAGPASLTYAPWPTFDPRWLIEETIEIPVQVNGKVRDVVRVPATATGAELERAALAAEKAQPFLAGKPVRKIIVVPRKLVNVVVG